MADIALIMRCRMSKAIHKNMGRCEKCGTPFWEKLCYTCQIEQLQSKIQALDAEKKECRKILEEQLDRDKDPEDSLRDLVVVACNALYWARAKKKHFVMAKLQAELEKLRWIPVTERPPEKSGQVWICYEITGYTYQAYYDVEYKKWSIFDPCGGFSDIDFDSPPTHWKPIILPESEVKDE